MDHSSNYELKKSESSLLTDCVCNYGRGIRPALYLKSDVSLPVDKETSLEDCSSVELLQELLRRESELY